MRLVHARVLLAEAEGLRGVLEPMVRAGLSYRAMADALAGVGKLSSTGPSSCSGSDRSDPPALGIVGKVPGQ